jgi:hypothetical protein
MKRILPGENSEETVQLKRKSSKNRGPGITEYTALHRKKNLK